MPIRIVSRIMGASRSFLVQPPGVSRSLHDKLRVKGEWTGIMHVKNDGQTHSGSFKTSSICWELMVLRLMRVKSLHRVVEFMLEAKSNTLLGNVSRFSMKPFMNQFCLEGSVEEVVNAVKSKALDTRYVIFDYTTEMIKESHEARHTADQYHAYLNHENVHMIAVKLTGICRPEILEQGDHNFPEVQAARQMLTELAAEAKAMGKTIFIDAEHFKAEKTILELAKPLMEAFQGHVYLTFQATRKDSINRLNEIVDALSEGKKLYYKLVKGAYNSDRIAFPNEFYQEFEGTHMNYLALLEQSVSDPRIEVLPCTHNPELIQKANSLGIKWVGNLNGMEVTDRCVRYVAANDDPEKNKEYLQRRFHEHKDSLEPRAENFRRQKLGLPLVSVSNNFYR